MTEIKLQITPKGGIQMLHNDALDLAGYGGIGDIHVKRASHVEYAECATVWGGEIDRDEKVRPAGRVVPGWYVQSAKTLKILKDGFSTRKEALDWEKVHYSPGGKGWAELVDA